VSKDIKNQVVKACKDLLQKRGVSPGLYSFDRSERNLRLLIGSRVVMVPVSQPNDVIRAINELEDHRERSRQIDLEEVIASTPA